MTENEESQKREEEFSAISEAFKTGLDVDDTMARLLIAEGFTSVDELLLVPVEELANVEGLDADIAEELRNRATAHVEKQQSKLKSLKISDELSSFEGLNSDMLVALAENKIKTLDDLADLATDELLDMLPKGMLNAHQAEAIIMRARQHWFADDSQ
jgi:N utilization substance protein A